MSPTASKWVAVSMAALLVVGGTFDASAMLALGGANGESDIDPERVDIRIRLHPNGSAGWTIEYSYRLDTDNRSAAFEDLQADIRENRSKHRSAFRSRIGTSVARAQNDTGRTMAMRDVSVEARRQQIGSATGLVTFRFRWTNFSRTNGSRLVAGDAIDGFIVDERTRLEFSWPAGYELQSVRPAPPDERVETAVAWEGYTNFPAGQPRLTVGEQPTETVEPTSADRSTDTDSPDGPTPGGSGETPLGALQAILLAAAVVLVGSLGWAYGRFGDEEGRSGADDGSDAPRPTDDLPMELMSNEERVLHTLGENGGRMKQTALREELDWAAPKTSKVLGDLKEDDAVDVFRLGRKNVVTLPDTGLTEDADE